MPEEGLKTCERCLEKKRRENKAAYTREKNRKKQEEADRIAREKARRAKAELKARMAAAQAEYDEINARAYARREELKGLSWQELQAELDVTMGPHKNREHRAQEAGWRLGVTMFTVQKDLTVRKLPWIRARLLSLKRDDPVVQREREEARAQARAQAVDERRRFYGARYRYDGGYYHYH